MPATCIPCAKKAIAILIAIAAGAAASYACGWIYLVIGVLTHVIAMCSDAPRWWEITYECLSVFILIGGILVGWWTYRWYSAKQRQKLLIDSCAAEERAEP